MDFGRVLSEHARYRICLGALLLLLSACQNPDPALLSPTLDLTRPGPAEPSPPRLAAHRLTTHAEYDVLETKWAARKGQRELLALMGALRGNRPDDILLTVRLCLLQLDWGGAGMLPRIIPMAEQLRQRHPEHPDVMHLLGESAFTLLPHDSETRAFAVDAATAHGSELGRSVQPLAMARTAARLWRGLIQRHPDWVGPHGITTADLAARSQALEAAVAAAEARSEAGDPPAPTEAEAEYWLKVMRFHEVLESEGAESACRHGREALALQKNPAFEAVYARHCAGSVP
jgi:hypothetical protein